MTKEDIVRTNIKLKDVSKVMREVGYNKTNIDSKRGSNIEDQLARANENAKSVPTMADAVNRAVAAVTPPVEAPIKVPVNAESEKPKGSKSKAVKKLKEKHAPKKEEKPKGPKKVIIDMTTLKVKVTFVGTGWIPQDIKMANAELIRAFRIKIRDEYRKGIK